MTERYIVPLTIFGIILIFIGMAIFDGRSGFTSMSTEGKNRFFQCDSTFHSYETGYCFADFFTVSYLIPITIASLAFQGAGIVAIVLAIKRKKPLLLGLSTTGALIVFGVVLLSVEMNSDPTDSELIAKTKNLREVHAFLAKYPTATSVVLYRSASEIAIQHEISNFELQGKPENYTDPQFARLWMAIYMSVESLRLEQVSLHCSAEPVGTNGYTYQRRFDIHGDEILPYLENGRERICFEWNN